MKGYFITAEQVEELGLLENPAIVSNFQKTIIVITQNDILKDDINPEFSDDQIKAMADWFYKNYYDSLIDTFTSF